MSLDEFEQQELKAAYDLCKDDQGVITEAGMKKILDLLGSGLSEDDVHDMFQVSGAGKTGFTEEAWMKAFEHKDHGDQDEEVNAAFAAVSSGGALDLDKAKQLIAMAGLDLKPKEFEEFKNIADYNSDGKIDLSDFVNMIHAPL